jgi:hypothetical protein
MRADKLDEKLLPTLDQARYDWLRQPDRGRELQR